MSIFKKKMGSFCHSWLKSLSPNLFRGEIWYKNTLILQVCVFWFFFFFFLVLFCFVLLHEKTKLMHHFLPPKICPPHIENRSASYPFDKVRAS